MVVVETAKGRLVYHLQHEIIFFEDAADSIEGLLPHMSKEMQEQWKHIAAIRRNMAEESRLLLKLLDSRQTE